MLSCKPKHDVLFLGSSSAVNYVGVVKLAHDLGKRHTIVIVLCDNVMRHQSKFYSTEYLSAPKVMPFATTLEFLDH